MGRARDGIEAALLEFLQKKGFCSKDGLAVAYSGGPDSTALLAALSAVGWKRPLAIHVDHGIRPREELDEERSIIEDACASLGARLVIARVRPGAVLERAKASGEGVEATARRYRYAALRSVMARSGAKAVLLAHTRDDQAETLLMRVLGGAGAGGLMGMSASNGPFLRPFLQIEKKSLLAYLAGKGIAYSNDSTNESDDYLRNRVRKHLVPILDSVFPGWRKGLAKTAAKAACDEEALSKSADALAFAPQGDRSSELSLPAGSLLGAPKAVALRSIIRAAGSLLAKERFSSSMAEAALDAISSGEGSLYRGGGLELAIARGEAVMRRSPAFPERGGLDFPRHGGYFVLIDRPRRVRVGALEVRAEWESCGRSGIRADAFRFPLVVRSRRPGDAIALKEGTKRLDDLLSEWALPERARNAAPVVEDRDGIVAVLGAGLGGKDRYRARPEGARPMGAISSGEGERRLSVIVKGA